MIHCFCHCIIRLCLGLPSVSITWPMLVTYTVLKAVHHVHLSWQTSPPVFVSIYFLPAFPLRTDKNLFISSAMQFRYVLFHSSCCLVSSTLVIIQHLTQSLNESQLNYSDDATILYLSISVPVSWLTNHITRKLSNQVTVLLDTRIVLVVASTHGTTCIHIIFYD